MLSSKYRLTKAKDFKKVNAFGRSLFSRFFRLKYLANNLESSRLAIVTSTRVSKKATVRNRIRRQLREIIRLNLAKIKAGYDIVIFVQIQALAKNYQELEQEIFALLTKAKLIK